MPGKKLDEPCSGSRSDVDEQFCCPGRSAQENVVCKRLLFDHILKQKQAFGMCACILKSCYDRIVYTAASITMQWVGIPSQKIQSMFGSVQKLVHKVRTLFGDSTGTYGGEIDKDLFEFPAQGTGQGNGTAPSIWSVLSLTIFDILHEAGYGTTTFVYALSSGLFWLCGFSYVNDCDLFRLGDNVDIVVSELKGMLAMWDHLMKVNGTAIAPNKCWWHLANFSWKGRKWYTKVIMCSLTVQTV